MRLREQLAITWRATSSTAGLAKTLMEDTKAAEDTSEPAESPVTVQEQAAPEEQSEEAVAASLLSIPIETALQIFEWLKAEDLVRLAACCTQTRRIMTSDDVWKSRCLALWSKHGSCDLSNGSGNPFLMSEEGAPTEQYYELYRGLLGPNARYLGESPASITAVKGAHWLSGDFASSLPYNGRLIRFSIHATSDVDVPLVDRFRILARELSIANVYSDRGYATEWQVPTEHYSPFRGHSMDLFVSLPFFGLIAFAHLYAHEC